MNKSVKQGARLLFLLLVLIGNNSRGQGTRSSDGVATTINLHFEVINAWVGKTQKSFRPYLNYNRSLNNHFRDASPMFPYTRLLIRKPNESIDTRRFLEAIEKAKKAGEQSARFSESKLPALFSELLELQEELIGLNQELIDLTKTRPSGSSSYQKAYQLLDSLSLSRESYRKKARLFYEESKKFYAVHHVNDVNNAWVKSGNKMKNILDEARDIMLDAKQYYLGQSSALPDTVALADFLKKMQAERAGNLKGIKELGRYNGNDAPSKYDDVMTELQQMLKELPPKSIPGRQTASYYFDAVLYRFNRAVGRYNAFVKLSFRSDLLEPPAYLMQMNKEPDLYHFISSAKSEPEQIVKKSPVFGSMEGYAFNHLVLLLDVSGSMDYPNKLPLLKKAIKEVASIMRTKDKLSVVIYSDQAKLILNQVSFTDKEAIEQLQQLKSSGKTDAKKGIQLAYQIAEKNKVQNGNNRVIMATDGDFVLDKAVYKLVKAEGRAGIPLSVFAFGKQSEQLGQLKKVANLGSGNYVHVNTENSISALLDELRAVRFND